MATITATISESASVNATISSANITAQIGGTSNTTAWGMITGDIEAQTDLQDQFDTKEDSFTKNTAFNKNFGTTNGTVAQGDHLHTGTYEPADNTILKDADIGVTVQGYNANTVVDADYSSDKLRLANTSGTNTGDQDLSGLLPNSHLTDFAHSDIAHSNRSALDLVSGTNTGDQDLSGYQLTSEKGQNNGYASLGSDGKVPSTQLPSYVDDIEEYANLASFPVTGESGKLYLALDTSLLYRWSGSTYAEVSQSLALGETSTTAYRGDRGKTAYDHSQTTGNPHGTTYSDVGAEPANANIQAHISSTSNPHSTTLEQARTAGNTLAGDVNFNGNDVLSVGRIKLDTAYTPTGETAGTIYWNADEETVDVVVNANVTLQAGQEMLVNVKNQTGSTITNGTPVMFAGTLGASGRILIQPAIADGSIDPSYILGIATENILDGADGKVTWFGKVRGIDTDGSLYGETWADGEILYVSPTTAGYLTKVRPQAPDRAIQVCAVIHSANNGVMMVRPTWMAKLSELDDVDGADPTTTGQLLSYNATTGVWERDAYNIEDRVPFTMCDAEKDPTGWVDNTLITQTYDSVNRTVTLTGTLDYYWRGKPYSLTSPWTSTAHANTPGGYFLYSTDGVNFTWSNSPWEFSDLQVGFVSYGTNSFGIREVHGMMPWQVHRTNHNVIGTWKDSGGVVEDYVLNSTTALDRRPTVSEAYVNDEDIRTNIPALPSGTYTQAYLTSTGIFAFNTAGTDIVPLSTNRPYYNQFTGGVWQQTLMSNNYYMAVWVLQVPVMADTNSQKFRTIFIQGQEEANNIDIIAGLEPNSLSLGNFEDLSPEAVFISKITIKYSGGNWTIQDVKPITGTKYYQVSTLSGNYLSAVYTNAGLSGTGTSTDPLYIDIGELTEDTTPDTANDFLMTLDATDGSNKKVLLDNLIGTVPIAKGGTGQTTAQLAINALTQVAGATNEYVLTKDTASGNAIFKASAGGGGYWTQGTGVLYPTTLTDKVGIGTNSPIISLNVSGTNGISTSTFSSGIDGSTTTYASNQYNFNSVGTPATYQGKNIGITCTNATVNFSGTTTSNTKINGNLVHVSQSSTSSSTNAIIRGTETTCINSAPTVSVVHGLYSSAQHKGSGTASQVVANYCQAKHSSAGTTSALYGTYSDISSSSGSITTMTAMGFNVLNTSSTITSLNYINLSALLNIGTITNTYGINIGTLKSGTQTNDPYSIYSSDANAHFYHNGRVSIGVARDTTVKFFVKGTDNTNGNYAIKSQDSAGTDLFTIRNDGGFAFKGGTVGLAQTGWTTANYSADKTLDVNTATTTELANVLCTLIEALKEKGIVLA